MTYLAGLVAWAAAAAILADAAFGRYAVPRRCPGSGGDVSGSSPSGGRGRPTRTIRRRGRGATADPASVAAWLDDVARDVRVGQHLMEAASSRADDDRLGGSGRELSSLLRRGLPVGEAARRWGDALPPADEASAAATALIVADEVGGSVGRPLERAAAARRRAVSEHDELAGWSAQARLSAIVMAVLPVGFLAFLLAADGDVRAVITTPIGSMVVLSGAVLDGMGFWWMRRMIRRASR